MARDSDRSRAVQSEVDLAGRRQCSDGRDDGEHRAKRQRRCRGVRVCANPSGPISLPLCVSMGLCFLLFASFTLRLLASYSASPSLGTALYVFSVSLSVSL